jgi:hypothetical protein
MPQLLPRGPAFAGLGRANLVWQGTGGRVRMAGLEALSVRGTASVVRVGVNYGLSF